MSNKKRLHKGTLATKAFKRITALVFPLFIYSIVGISEGEYLQIFLIMLGVLAVFLLFGFIFDLIKYLRTTYYIDHNRFILKTGLIIRKEKDIQISRIQSVDTSESIAHRLLKLTKVTIQTPGKNILLDAISLKQLDEITQQLHQLNETIEITDEKEAISKEEADEAVSSHTLSEGSLLHQLSISDLIKLTLLNTSVIRSFIVFLFASSFVSNFLIDFVFEQSGQLLRTSLFFLSFLILGIIITIYVLGAVITIIKQYHFRVFLNAKQLVIKRGLLETNSQTIVLDNVQSVEEQQNWLMKKFGFTTISLSIATDEQEDEVEGKKDNETSGKVVLFPLVRMDQLATLMESCFPQYQLSSAHLVTPKRAIRRFVQFRLLFLIIVFSCISYFLWSYAWIPGLLLVLLTFVYGYRSYRLNGYDLSENELTIQVAKTFSIKRTYIFKERILNMKVKQNLFLKRAALAKISCFSSQGQLAQNTDLLFIEDTDAFELFNWFKPKKIGDDTLEPNRH